MRRTIKVFCPAKINLALYIGKLREDGYHDILTLFQAVSIYDEIFIEDAPDLSLTVFGEIPCKIEHNIVYKTSSLLKRRFNIEQGAKITLKKVIPSGAGLGGGSSDAAGVIKGLSILWGIEDALGDVAASIGADVPFFLKGGMYMGEGIGEILTSVRGDLLKEHFIVVFTPFTKVSTPKAYKWWDEHKPLPRSLSNIKNKILEYTQRGQIFDICHNDFEEVVFPKIPEIMEIKSSMERFSPEVSLMSGSGSSVFGIFKSKKRAEETYRYFKSKQKGQAFLCIPIPHGVWVDKEDKNF